MRSVALGAAPPIMVACFDGMDVVSLCPLPVGVLWWESPARTLTVVIKGTFSLEGRREARLAERQEPLSLDRQSAAGDADELEYASDFAPRKARADVLLVGHARAAAPCRVIPVRLAVGELDLRLSAVAGAPAAEIPLLARHLRRDPEEAATSPVGPRAPWAPERSALAGAGWVGEDGLPAVPLPEHFDYSFFNAAPRAQQIRGIDPWGALALEGLLPGRPQRSGRVPAAWPRVFLLDAAAGERGVEGAEPGAELDLRCDTLWIDVDRALCTLTWRGEHVVDPRGPEPGSLVVALASSVDPAGWEQIRDRLDGALVASPISAADLREAQRPPPAWTPEQAEVASAPGRQSGASIELASDEMETLLGPRAAGGSAPPAAMPRTLDGDGTEAEITLPRRAAPAEAASTLDDTEATLPRPEAPAISAPARGGADALEEEETTQARSARAQTLDDADVIEVEGTRSVRPSQLSPALLAPGSAPAAAPAAARAARDASEATLTIQGSARRKTLPFLSPAALAAARAPTAPGLQPGAPAHEPLSERTITSVGLPSPEALPFQRGPAPSASRTAPPQEIAAPALPFAPALFALSPAPVPAPASAPVPAPAPAPAPVPAPAPAPAPAVQPSLLPPATYAAVRAALREGKASLEEVLAPYGIEPSDWHANERRQAEALAEEARRGGDALAVALFEAMRAAEQRGADPADSGELSLEDYVAVQLEVEAAEDPGAALAARGISAAAWRRLQQRWRQRALGQRSVAEALRRALAEGRARARAAPPTPGGPEARPGARAAP